MRLSISTLRTRLVCSALAAALGAALLFVGGAGAGTAEYATTLWLSNAASGLVATSNALVTTQPPTTPTTAPGPLTITATAGNPSGTYQYQYTLVDPLSGGETPPSAASGSVAPVSKQVDVGLPAATLGQHIRLYRRLGGGSYFQIADIPSAAATYTDNVGNTGLTQMPPLAQSRPKGTTNSACPVVLVTWNTCGYGEFPARRTLVAASGTEDNLTSTLSATPSGSGWLVDGAGSVSFAAATWNFTLPIQGAPYVGLNVVAGVAVRIWKVTISGGAITSSTLLADGENTTTNVITAGTVNDSVNVSVPAFGLDAGEHLYFQVYRKQTGSYITVSFPNRVLTLRAGDGVAKLTLPTANAAPAASPATPADASSATPATLAAGYADAEGDSGTVDFRVCTSAAAAGALCSGPVSSGTTASVADGATASWSVPAGLAAGTTYYWQARAQDTAGGTSAWSATRSFTTNPATSASLGPDDGVYVAAPVLSVDYTGTGDGSVSYAICDDAVVAGTACAHVVDTHTAVVTNGSTASWTVATALTHGTTYYWQSRAQDSLGSYTPWTASRAFTFDTAPASVTVSGTSDGSFTTTPQLTSTYSDPDGDAGTVDFQLCTTPATAGSACAGVAASSSVAASGGSASWAPTSLTQGATYYWQARAHDTYGATSAWSATRSFIRDTAPSVAATGSLDVTLVTTPVLTAAYSDADADSGTIQFEVCTSASCATAVLGNTVSLSSGANGVWTIDSGLSHGTTYYWHARARDVAGATSDWTSPRPFIIDLAPAASLVGPDGGFVVSPSLSARYADPEGDSGTLDLQVCKGSAVAGTACSDVVASTTLSATSGATAAWSPAGLARGTTYHWQARPHDGYGAVGEWTATRSLVLDTAPTAAPATPDGAESVPALRLAAAYGDAEGDAGTVSFRVCSAPAPADAACDPAVATGSVAAGAGSTVSWSGPKLADGTYYWQVRAEDAPGADSGWSATRKLLLDTNAPSAPLRFRGEIVGETLRLSWARPADDDALDHYVLFANGEQRQTLPADALTVSIPRFDGDVTATFALLAVDTAGNVGSFSATLVAVPELVGLSVDRARVLLAARGLTLAKRIASVDGMIVGQTPAAPAVVARGSAIGIAVLPALAPKPARTRGQAGTSTAGTLVKESLLDVASSDRVVCGPRALLRVRLDLARDARVSASLLSAGGRPVASWSLGTLEDGDAAKLRLPRTLAAGERYWVVLTARGRGQSDRAMVGLTVPKAGGSAACRAA